MIIRVVRKWKKPGYTIGRMYLGNSTKHWCNTLEDTDRGLKQTMSEADIKRIKVYGQTAIPEGTYNVGYTYWSKHKIYVPWVKDVPGYTGILIHNGASAADTLGCILVGENTIVGRLTNGKKYMTELTNLVKASVNAKEPVKLIITNEY